MKTRQAITESNQAWEIPENLWGGAQNKEGWNANDLGENKVKENEEILANAFKAIEGKVPQKVCAPVGTAWPDEYIRISNAYTSFTNWVTESNPARWTFQTRPRLVNLNLDDNSNPEQD